MGGNWGELAGESDSRVTVTAPNVPPMAPEHKLCFVVMPYGRDEEEQVWFKGWYQEVIEPAIRTAGYEPTLAAATDAPSLITDEIRSHLAKDPMVVVDLGGVKQEDDPNPNVMYELGLRHAFDLPHVIMSWKDQYLPFDIGGQRVLKQDRRALYFDENRRRLGEFIKEAEQGNFYKPMEAVKRVAQLQQVAGDDKDKVLARAVSDMNAELTQLQQTVRQLESERQRDISAGLLERRLEEISSRRVRLDVTKQAFNALEEVLLKGPKPRGENNKT